jgi:DNA-binding MurR/RpiR family transcriptional regulator
MKESTQEIECFFLFIPHPSSLRKMWIKEVAREAGVSTATISHVIN